mmetsp:Transcript_14169/g.21626  ORF Transcript_14169/g.21626 Transcript_14169/m.21626 type:complete len:122 (-) Transcript_14169:163-528(-)
MEFETGYFRPMVRFGRRNPNRCRQSAQIDAYLCALCQALSSGRGRVLVCIAYVDLELFEEHQFLLGGTVVLLDGDPKRPLRTFMACRSRSLGTQVGANLSTVLLYPRRLPTGGNRQPTQAQ